MKQNKNFLLLSIFTLTGFLCLSAKNSYNSYEEYENFGANEQNIAPDFYSPSPSNEYDYSPKKYSNPSSDYLKTPSYNEKSISASSYYGPQSATQPQATLENQLETKKAEIQEAINTIRQTVPVLTRDDQQTLTQLGREFADLTQQQMTLAQQTASSYVNTGKQIAYDKANQLKNNVNQYAQNSLDAFNKQKENVINTFNTQKNNLINTVNKHKDEVVKTYNDQKQKALNTLNAKKDAVLNKIQNHPLVQKITKHLSNKNEDFQKLLNITADDDAQLEEQEEAASHLQEIIDSLLSIGTVAASALVAKLVKSQKDGNTKALQDAEASAQNLIKEKNSPKASIPSIGEEQFKTLMDNFNKTQQKLEADTTETSTSSIRSRNENSAAKERKNYFEEESFSRE